MALVGGEIVGRLISLAAIAWLTRALGVEGFGLLSFSLAVATCGVVIAQAGLDRWGSREAARGGGVSLLAGRVVALRVPLALAAFALLLAFAWLQPHPAARPALVILATLVLIDAVNLAWLFLGLEQMRLVVLATNLKLLFVGGAVLLVVREASHLELAAMLTVGGELLGSFLLLAVFLRRHGRAPVRIDLPFSRAALAQSFPFAAVAALAVVRYNFDILLIGFLFGEAATGLYGAPYRVLTFLISLSAAYFTSLLPALARCCVADPALGLRLVERSVRLMSVCVLPIAVGGTVLADELVVLLFGPAFERSADVFRVLIWALVPLCLAGGYRNLFRAYDRQALEMRAVAWSAATNVALNLALVPTWGLIGAASATIAGELVLLGLCWRWARGLLARPIATGALLRPLVAALGMGGALLLLPPRPALVSLAVGPLVYFPLLLLLRGLDWTEIRALRRPWSRPGDSPAPPP